MYTHHGPMLYLTKDDQVVEEGDPRAAFVLVADGGQLPDDVAEKYGLTGEKPAVTLTPEQEAAAPGDDQPTAAEIAALKAKQAPANKLKQPAPANKGKGAASAPAVSDDAGASEES